MRATCMVIVALFFLVVSNLAIIISFATPYWMEFRDPVYNKGGNHHRGLWAYCSPSNCRWVFDNNFLIQKDLGVLIQITQALYSFGASCGLLSLLIATMALCCDCKCNAHKAVAILLILAVVFMSVGLVIYGIAMNETYNVSISWEKDSRARICWSFWLGVGACVVSFLTSIIYAFESHVTSYN
ncbi:transmembrane 47-like [Argonauta hians]